MLTTTLKKLTLVGLCSASTLLSGIVSANTYPDRNIQMLVPFPPGGVADSVGRPFAHSLSSTLGRPVVIENRGGAGGAIGMAASANAKPDGYNTLFTLSSISIIPEADKVLERKPAYVLDQFKPIARITADPTVLVVGADAPWNTLEEFIAAAKKDPGAINYGSSGIYGTMHVPMEMLAQEADIQLSHIPFTGGGPAVTALLGKHVDALATGPATVIQHIKAGTLKPLAHWGTKPVSSMPEVKSLKELGYDAEFIQWSGMFVPAETPEHAVQALLDASRKASQDTELRKTLEAAGSPMDYLDGEEFNAYWQADAQRLANVIQKMGKVD